MEWLSENWVWILFFVGMIAMHMFGHGGHGGGGDSNHKPVGKDDVQRTSQQSGHRH